MKTCKFKFLHYIALLSSLFLVSCGSSDSTAPAPSSSVNLTGLVGSGYVVALAPTDTMFAKFLRLFDSTAYALAAGTGVNTVIALRNDSGDLSSYSVINSKSTTINPDGTFSLALDNSTDWILLLMNTNATGTGQFVGTVALNADNVDSLLNLPTTTASASTIDLGVLTNTGDIAMSASAVNATDFTLDAAQLLTLAKTDDMFQNAKNLVLNYDKATGVYYTLRPDFFWRGTYAGLDTTASDPKSYLYNHYNFQLDSNSTDVAAMADLCGATPVTKLELFPPASAVSSSPVITYGTTVPITNDAAICTTVTTNGAPAIEASEYGVGGDFFASNAYGGVSATYGGYIGGTIPPGYWQYKVNTVTKGQFDVSAIAPLATNTAIKGFSPAIKVNADGTGKITSIDITWYLVSADGATATALAPADLSLLKHAIGSGDIYLDYSTGTRRYESIHFDPSTQTSVTPTGTWYYNVSAGAANELATGIGVFYNSAGVGYFIEFFK